MSRSRSLLVILLALTLVGAGALLSPAPAGPKPQLDANHPKVREGDGTATVVLTLVGKARHRTVVSWRTVDGSARSGQDYRAKAGTVVFGMGQRSQRIRVAIVDDELAESSERFSVRLRSRDARVPATDVRVVVRDDDASDGFDVVLAGDRAVSHTFDVPVSAADPTLRGASMTATGPDGTVYTLDVPTGALADTTTVTMTPWRSATGTGITGGRLFGVRLLPHGTEFLLPVTLQVDPPGADDVRAVTMTREGSVSHEQPAALDTDAVVMSLMHFSEFYGGLGDGLDPIPVSDPGVLDPAQAVADQIARELREERDRQLRGEEPDPSVMTRVADLLALYYDTVVKPLLPGIRTDCTQARSHTGQVVGWARQAALLGVLPAEQQAVLDATAAGAENCLREALEPCVDKGDAEQMARIFGYWRHVLILGGTVPDPDPLDPVRECQDLVAGTLTVTFDKVLEVNGFRTEEHWTLVYQPRFVNPERQQVWYDDGRGGWSVSGTYLQEDLRDGAECPVMSERTYSGSGTLFTSFHGQLDPETDRGRGIAELDLFLPWYDGNFGLDPTFDGEAVGTSTRTTYRSTDDGCVSSTEDVGHWFSPQWGPGLTAAPGTVVDDPQKGRGVQFAYTFTRDDSEGDTIDRVATKVVGSVLPAQG